MNIYVSGLHADEANADLDAGTESHEARLNPESWADAMMDVSQHSKAMPMFMRMMHHMAGSRLVAILNVYLKLPYFIP